MKIKSGLITQASGKIGGMVASHNKGGMYLRSGAVPTNPNTSLQQAVRSAFGTGVQGWETLSDAERAGWDGYAANTPRTNSLGEQFELTGQQAFVGVATLRGQLGLAAVTTAPVINNTGNPVTSISAVSVATGITINVAGGASDDGDVAIWLGQNLNDGRTFYKGPYRLGGVAAIASAATTVGISPSDPWGSFFAGARVSFRTRIAYDDGRVSQQFASVLAVSA